MQDLLTAVQRRSLALGTESYARNLAPVAGYLADRGISVEVASTYRLGCVVDPLPGHDIYRGRLTIPYLTPTGPVDLRFRALRPDQDPKYLNLPGRTANLYNVGAFQRPGDDIAICEGELDALVMDALVGVPAVGVPGATNWKPFWQKLFVDYERVFILCDGDEAGKTFGKALAKAIESAVVIHLPAGEDVNSLYMTQGRSALRQLMGV